MVGTRFDESTIEQAAKEWLAEIGFYTGYAPVDAAVDEVRNSLGDCILWSYVLPWHEFSARSHKTS